MTRESISGCIGLWPAIEKVTEGGSQIQERIVFAFGRQHRQKAACPRVEVNDVYQACPKSIEIKKMNLLINQS